MVYPREEIISPCDIQDGLRCTCGTTPSTQETLFTIGYKWLIFPDKCKMYRLACTRCDNCSLWKETRRAAVVDWNKLITLCLEEQQIRQAIGDDLVYDLIASDRLEHKALVRIIKQLEKLTPEHE